jgi:hypothetical protein
MVGAFAAMLLQDHFKRIQHLERLLADGCMTKSWIPAYAGMTGRQKGPLRKRFCHNCCFSHLVSQEIVMHPWPTVLVILLRKLGKLSKSEGLPGNPCYTRPEAGNEPNINP